MPAEEEVERRDHHVELLRRYVEYHCWVLDAKKKGRFFHIVSQTNCANFKKLRRELKKRGFVEQKPIPSESIFMQMPNTILLEEAKEGNEYEQALIAKMIGRRKPDLVFLNKAIEYRYFHSTPFLSKIAFSKPPSFICKNGMLDYVETITKNKRLNKGVYFPRAYDVSTTDGTKQFLDDYRLTAALSLILFLHRRLQCINMHFTSDWPGGSNQPPAHRHNHHSHHHRRRKPHHHDSQPHEEPTQQPDQSNGKNCEGVDGSGSGDDASISVCYGSCCETAFSTQAAAAARSDSDTVRINGVDYAISVISMHIKYADGNLSEDELAKYNLSQTQWREVVDTHVAVVKNGKRISYANNPTLKEYVIEKIRVLGEDIPLYWPNIHHDGMHNMWLLKPSYTGQGWGIILESDEKRLLELMQNKSNHYICQK